VKGHSCRKGRSQCASKIGPSSRAHKRKSVVRRDAERHGPRIGRPAIDSYEILVVDPGAADDRRSS
jgi:flavoprotein